MQHQNVDVAVIGLGAHGSSTLYHLSTKYPNLQICGIEKHTAGNQLGSSGGLSRIIRLAYFESPSYVMMLKRSYELYRQIETEAQSANLSYESHPQHSDFTSGHTLLHITGGLDIGPLGSSMVNGAIAACKEHNLEHEVLTPDQVAKRWPITLPGQNYRAVYQKDAGFLEPEKINFTMVQLAAKKSNTNLFFEHSIIDVEQTTSTSSDGYQFKLFMVPTADLKTVKDPLTLKDKSTVIDAKKIVICTGPWVQDTMNWSIFTSQRSIATPTQSKLFTKLDKFFTHAQTQVQRQVVNWHDITPSSPNPTAHDSPNFPIFLIHHHHNYLDSEYVPDTGSNNDIESKITTLASASTDNYRFDENGELIVDASNTTAVNDSTPYDHFYYGFPSMRPGDNTMKIGRYHHLLEDNVHQDTVNRSVHFLDIMATAHCQKYFFPHVLPPQWYDDCNSFIQKCTQDITQPLDVERVLSMANDENKAQSFPLTIGKAGSTGELSSHTQLSKVCTFTNTFDGHFLIQPMTFGPTQLENLEAAEPSTNNPNILILSACSGHGFKFNAVIGEICADIMGVGKSQFDIEWFGAGRIPL